MGVDLRRRGLPREIFCGPVEGWREVETDFRAWVAFDHGLQRGVALYCVFPEGSPRPRGDGWVASAREFLESPVSCPHGSQGAGARALDLVEDGDYVVAAFQQAYGIDLTDPGLRLHWHRFMALLRGVPDSTLLGRVMQWRTWREDRRSQERRMADLRRAWALPTVQDERTLAWQEAAFGSVRPRTLRGGDG